MDRYYILFNSTASCGKGEELAHQLDQRLQGDLTYHDVMKVEDYAVFFHDAPSNSKVILCGGDGTLNRFVNRTRDLDLPYEIYYYAAGTGNDFLHDIEGTVGDDPIRINQYLKDLPTATVKGKEYLFINDIGFGIDGYCTMVGDEQRRQGAKKINYTTIAIGGLLGKYHPQTAHVTVDGINYDFENAWLAPTMKGRYYGGGMMPAPDQDRLDPEHKVTVMVYCGVNKLKTMCMFPSIFKGTHVRFTKYVTILEGSHVHVRFDQPAPVQIDGETIMDVLEYEVNI